MICRNYVYLFFLATFMSVTSLSCKQVPVVLTTDVIESDPARCIHSHNVYNCK